MYTAPMPRMKLTEEQLMEMVGELVAAEVAKLAGSQAAAEPTDEEKVMALIRGAESNGNFVQDDDGVWMFQPADDSIEVETSENAEVTGEPDQAASSNVTSIFDRLRQGAEGQQAKADDAKPAAEEWKFTDWGDPEKRAARFAAEEAKEASNG